MSFEEKQKRVDEWVSQFKISYFSPHEIIVQLSEELGELAEAISKKQKEQITEEVSDVVFALICLTNRHNIKLNDVYEEESENKDAFLNLTIRIGQLSREISHTYGPKKKKKTEAQSSIKQRLEESFKAINYFVQKYEINLDEAFSKHMNKLYGRDNTRWEKNETSK